jgi:hypothetical protein
MVVSDLEVTVFEPELDGWSGDFISILDKLGFIHRSSSPGPKNNKLCDGEYHYFHIVSRGAVLYSVEIYSNYYNNEKDKLRDILNSNIAII